MENKPTPYDLLSHEDLKDLADKGDEQARAELSSRLIRDIQKLANFVRSLTPKTARSLVPKDS